MLQTKGSSLVALAGIDQQSIEALQLVQGTFPFQVGLQQRIPGKTLERILDGPITSIYVFYLVYGRHYKIVDYGSQEIIEVEVTPIKIPPLPPKFEEWFDDFSGYEPDGLIARVWGAGYGNPFPGIVETFIRGEIDQWSLLDSLTPPAPVPPPPEVGEGGDVEDGGGNVTPHEPPANYPAGSCDDLPDTDYVSVSIASIFPSYYQSISANNYTVGSSGGSPTGYIDYPTYGTPYTTGGAVMQATRSRSRSASSSGTADAITSDTQVIANFDLSSRNDPIGTTYWLVGTQDLCDGTLNGSFQPNVVTTCAAVQFSTVGETFGNLQILATEGTQGERNPISPIFNVQANVGQVQYTEVRIYAPEES